MILISRSEYEYEVGFELAAGKHDVITAEHIFFLDKWK
jgi:hypothetical protein